MLRTIRTILKYLTTAILALIALGALGFSVIGQPGGPAGIALLVLLGVWCIGSVWFFHFRQRVSTIAQRWVAITLVVLPVCFYSELAHTKSFRRQRPQPYYPAASFVGYLIENYGLDAFRQLWTANARYSELYATVEDFG